MRTSDRIREVKREHMRRKRLDAAWRERTNAKRRGNAKYLARYRAYSADLRDNHFFRWRARNWQHGTAVSAADLMRLWWRQRGRCALSGIKLDRDAHLDHAVPKAVGGASTIKNLRWVDPRVNMMRGHLEDKMFADLCAQVAEWVGRRILEMMRSR